MKKLLLGTALLLTFVRALALSDTLVIYFDAGQVEVTAAQAAQIDRFMAAHRFAQTVVVAGHADATGDPATNLDHSRRRAVAVAAYALSIGLPRKLLMLEAWGETKPAVAAQCPQRDSLNRRVELICIMDWETAAAVAAQALDRIAVAAREIPYRVTTTPDGRPRRKAVIHSVADTWEGAELSVGSPTFLAGGVVFSDTFVGPADSGRNRLDISVVNCGQLKPFEHRVPARANVRCPLAAINYDHDGYDRTKTNPDGELYLRPRSTGTTLYYAVQLLDERGCFEPTFEMKGGCVDMQDVRIQFANVTIEAVSGRIDRLESTEQVVRQQDGSYITQHLAGDPASLQLSGTFKAFGRKPIVVEAVPLSSFPRDGTSMTYTIGRRDLSRWE